MRELETGELCLLSTRCRRYPPRDRHWRRLWLRLVRMLAVE